MTKSNGFTEAVARAFTWLIQVIAVWHFVGLILRRFAPQFVTSVSEILSVTNLPSDPSLFWGLVLAVMASGFARRKNVVLWIFLILFQVPMILAIVALIPIFMDMVQDPTTQSSLILYSVSVVFAVLSTILLVYSKDAFPAKLRRGAWLKALGVFAGGLLIASLIAYVGVNLVEDGISQKDALKWTASALWGYDPTSGPFSLDFVGPIWIAAIVEVVLALTVVIAFSTFLRSRSTDPESQNRRQMQARQMLLDSSNPDSLGYFATRDDRRLITSDDGRAGVSYKVLNGVMLAGGDPLGDKDAWAGAISNFMARARNYGWVPAAISTSEDGAKAYVNAGMHAATMGDESVVETEKFHLASNRVVRRAIAGPRNAGYTVKLRRQEDVPEAELKELWHLAETWRHGDERGYSMALGRLGDPRDPKIMVVTAHDSHGTPQALLTFVPWGRRGLSLDLMRRSPEAAAGVNELMMTELFTTGATMGVERVSLNFAMFRNTFVMSERVGATPLQRLTGKILTFASRWWQLKSLYESNAKYDPEWQRRLLCYPTNQQLTRVLIACGQAEGFLPEAPRAFRHEEQISEHDIQQTAALVNQMYADSLTTVKPRKLTEQQRVRFEKCARLEEAGMDPYPPGVPRTISLADVAGLDPHTPSEPLSVVGRVMRIRDHGGIIFADLREATTEFQVALEASSTADRKLWRAGVDRGDYVSITGTLGTSNTGQPTVFATGWAMAAKSLVPAPDKWRGITDPQMKVRARHMAFATDDKAFNQMRARSATVAALRKIFAERGYMEVETPILQRVHGGANARPFHTHINAYDLDLTLRIAPELFLKRLCVGGFDRVFEIGRNFRNEGADSTHNPEFTALEAYEAYGDYFTMRDLTRDLIIEAATAVHGEPKVPAPDGTWINLDKPWRSVTVHQAVSEAVGRTVTTETRVEELREICAEHDVEIPIDATNGALVTELYEELVEGQTWEPTFYMDFPLETSPLTGTHRSNPALAERWDLVAFGMELGTAYSELTDPKDQRDRLTRQSLLAAAGDAEAMEVDEEFLSALEFGMRPTGGLGIGVDRLVMFLIQASIRETLAFPFVREADR